MRYLFIAFTSACALLFYSLTPLHGAESGRVAFEKRCTGCHALDHEKSGPRLAGVFGRRAGSLSSYPYSKPLKKSNVVWNEATLDKWLADPDSVVPDSDMAFRLNNP